MAFYSVSRSNVALSTTNDFMTLITAANRRLLLHEVSISGMGIASAANELLVSRSTGGTTGGGAVTPDKVVSDAPAAATVVDTTWAAQPTLSGTGLLRLGCNANGGVYRWVAKPGEEIECRNAEQLSLRSALGTSSVSVHVVFEEI